MKTKIILRKATIEDVNDIGNVYLRSRKELVSFAPLIHSDESIYQWIRTVLLLEENVIVAEQEKIIIGMMSLKKTDNIGWINQLYINPKTTNQGAGTLMLKHAKSILGSPIRLYTFQENIGAKRFYERNGFQAIAFDDGSGNEENCPAILYEWVD